MKRTMGVEEEFLLVGEDGRPVAKASEALDASDDAGGGVDGDVHPAAPPTRIGRASCRERVYDDV